MLKILTAAALVVGTNAIDLTADTTKLCSETESGACHCENGNKIDEYRAKDKECFLGLDAEGQPIKFAFYPWLEAKKNCPIVGTVPAATLQKIWAESQECWADQNPCDDLPEGGVSGGFQKCAEVAEKEELEEEVNGEEEEEVKVVPKDPKLERSQPALQEALATGKGSNIFTEPSPFDKALSTTKNIIANLWAEEGQTAASLGSAEVSCSVVFFIFYTRALPPPLVVERRDESCVLSSCFFFYFCRRNSFFICDTFHCDTFHCDTFHCDSFHILHTRVPKMVPFILPAVLSVLPSKTKNLNTSLVTWPPKNLTFKVVVLCNTTSNTTIQKFQVANNVKTK
jgi:hypothetical protein